MKKAISVLLILATLLGCCSLMLSCKKDKDDPEATVTPDGTIQNESNVLLDFNDAAKVTENGLTVSQQVTEGATQSAKWTLQKTSAASRNITLNLTQTDLSAYKEITFWMYNDSTESVKFNFYFVLEDGTEHRAQAKLYAQHTNKPLVSAATSTVNSLTAAPGWHLYSIPFSETEQINKKSYDYVAPENEKDEGTITVKFDTSKIKSIRFDASQSQINTSTIGLHLTSICANTVKSGTLRGFAIPKIANAVCFYENSNAYLKDQFRYLLDADEKVAVNGDTVTSWVPIEILAKHRGANITANADGIITFNYNNTTYTFKVGDTVSFVGNERGFSAGVDRTALVTQIGKYVAVPMEVAAQALGYKLFYDQVGLIIFADEDLTSFYLDPLDPAYRESETNGLPAIYNIVQVIIFSTSTGEEIINDMNAIHGEDGHTKLMMTQDMFDYLKGLVKTDPTYRAWFERFESYNAKGTANYKSALPFFELSDGYRLLSMSRDVMGTLLTYSFLYKMTDNEDYAEKVKKTVMATTRFVDKELTNAHSWHPEHFLDTGELMYGVGIAYDWCYDYLAKDKKDLQTIEQGVWQLGYGAAMGFGELFDWWKNKENMNKWNADSVADGGVAWNKYNLPKCIYYVKTEGDYGCAQYNFDTYRWTNNWGAVCNGGMCVMALAFANVNTEFRAASQYILDCVMFNFPCTLYEGYAPDGGYPEGPGYWSYGTQYSILLISSLTTATGSDQGFTKAPGFRESFYFINATASTALGTWNYHDAGVGRTDGSRFFWFADQCGDKNIGTVRYNQLIEGKSGPSYWDLMYYRPENLISTVTLDLDYCYYGIGVVTFRSEWTDSALFCGLHGGANAASHGQLDIGNFILEYGGTRFFQDLGSDEYNLTGYSSNGGVTYFSTPYRYWYYRNKAEGHNTLVINPVRVDINNTSTKPSLDAGQKTNYDSLYCAESDILRFESGKTSALAVVDLGCAYRDAPNNYYVCPDHSNKVVYDALCECSSCKTSLLNGKQIRYHYFYSENKGEEGTLLYGCDACTACRKLDTKTGKYTYKIAQKPKCSSCSTTLTEPIANGIRGMLVSENRTTVVVQDEMYFATPSKVMWMGHVVKDAIIEISEDKKSALIKCDGKTLLVQIVTPEGSNVDWKFETQAADYLPETGLVMTPGEYNRDGLQKLVAIADNVTELKLAVVCKLLSAGPHNYTWTDIEDWTTDR